LSDKPLQESQIWKQINQSPAQPVKRRRTMKNQSKAEGHGGQEQAAPSIGKGSFEPVGTFVPVKEEPRSVNSKTSKLVGE
jgi:hypothetical protein